MRMYFVYRGRATPSGGHKQVRLMVSLLRELRVDASLLLDGNTQDDCLYDVDVPSAPFEFRSAGPLLRQDDIIVFPEIRLFEYLKLTESWRCRKAVNNQNAFYAMNEFHKKHPLSGTLEFGIANSSFVAGMTAKVFGLSPARIFYVPHWVVRAPFCPPGGGAPGRRLSICYMPRKLGDHVCEIRGLVESSRSDVEWMEIDGMGEREVAQVLRTHAVFLSTQDREGCPLPSLEAMTCGCLVAGYPGTWVFPHPYATKKNALWVADRSIRQAAAAVLEAVRMVENNSPQYREILNEGYYTVQAYSKERVLEALTEMVETIKPKSYRPRPEQIQTLPIRSRLGVTSLFLKERLEAMKKQARNFARLLQ